MPHFPARLRHLTQERRYWRSLAEHATRAHGGFLRPSDESHFKCEHVAAKLALDLSNANGSTLWHLSFSAEGLTGVALRVDGFFGQ